MKIGRFILPGVCVFLISSHMAKSEQIHGHVVDAAGGAIPNASIFVRRNMPSEEKVELAGHADPNGNFMLTLSPGAYDLLVTSIGFESQVRTILVRPGKNINLFWKLKIPKNTCDFPGINCDRVF